MSLASPIAAEAAPEASYEPHWVSKAAFPLVSGAMFASQIALAFAAAHHWYWLAVPLVFVTAHCMHGLLIGFHEASHGMLRKSRFLNDVDGMLLGAFSYMSFTLYRAAHQTHHVHLATERDEELWPFSQTTSPRWVRILAAFLELTFGIFFTPYVFFRTFVRKGSPIRSPRIRRRVWAEYGFSAVLWIALVTGVTLLKAWPLFLWSYVAPAWLAANMQSWRKYIEHVGLMGSTPNSSTRSIVSDTWWGKFISVTLLHEPYHGVHHQHAGVPHPELPGYAASLEPRHPDERPPFPSYWHALVDLFRCLPDPRVGAQWRKVQS